MVTTDEDTIDDWVGEILVFSIKLNVEWEKTLVVTDDTTDDRVGEILVFSIPSDVDVVVVMVFVGNTVVITVSTTERKQQIQCHSYTYVKNFKGEKIL